MSKFKLEKKFSLIIFVLLTITLWIIRIKSPVDNTLTWDVFGYYLWLPAKFIHHDIWLDNIDWIRDAMNKYNTSGSLYQAYIGPNGTWMFWFLLGTGLMYLPFFLIGLVWAKNSGYEVDGFSFPFQFCIAYGSLVYSIIGLFFTWKILMRFFSEVTNSVILIAIVLGTNYLQFTAISGAATPNFLFTLLAALIWFTIKWHEKPKVVYAICIGGLCAMSVLIKPSEIFCFVIPLLWNMSSKEDRKSKLSKIKKYWWHVLLLIFTGFIILVPQFYYWKQESGKWIFDSYNNPGIGLDVFKPHILKVLFSFRKGWLVYTPLMIFALYGFWHMYKRNKNIFIPVLVYFLITFYIVSSWTEWWYGGGFGQRPLITSYAVLVFPLGYFIESIKKKKALFGVILTIFGVIIVLNLFQTWQYNNYILSPDRMSRQYYFRIFGKTSVNSEDQNFLLVERSYTVNDEFKNSQDYRCRNIGLYDFEDSKYPEYEKYYYQDTTYSGVFSLKMDSTLEFSPEIRTTYSGLITKDYAWIKASVWFYFIDSVNGELPLLTVTTMHREGNYKYRNISLKKEEIVKGKWYKLELYYQTPEIRSENDEIVVYVWNRSKMNVVIDNLRADVYIPR
jgi:hypothetical protein